MSGVSGGSCWPILDRGQVAGQVQRQRSLASTVVLASSRRCCDGMTGVQESAWSISSMVNAVAMAVSSVVDAWWTAMEDAGKRWCARSPWSCGAQRRAGRAPPARHRRRDGRRRRRRGSGDGSGPSARSSGGRRRVHNGDGARFKITCRGFKKQAFVYGDDADDA
ncbi:hypothetical protein Dimus_037009 [Dionaea muscipula]